MSDYTNETVEVKTCNLIDAALDWAVAKCKGYKIQYFANVTGIFVNGGDGYEYFSPSRDWGQGGTIIEREKIQLDESHSLWGAMHSYEYYSYGPTPLIAAMRCYVASKLGDTVKIPKDLLLNSSK